MNIDPISGAELGCPNCAKLNALVDALRGRIRTLESIKAVSVGEGMQDHINKLSERVKELEAELRERDETLVDIEDRMSSANRMAANYAHQMQQAKRAAEDAEYFRNGVAVEISRAHQRGDVVDVERGLAKLKRGW